jgi:hypothetical protein
MSIPEKPGLFRALGQVMEIFLSLFRYTMQFIALLPMDTDPVPGLLSLIAGSRAEYGT